MVEWRQQQVIGDGRSCMVAPVARCLDGGGWRSSDPGRHVAARRSQSLESAACATHSVVVVGPVPRGDVYSAVAGTAQVAPALGCDLTLSGHVRALDRAAAVHVPACGGMVGTQVRRGVGPRLPPTASLTPEPTPAPFLVPDCGPHPAAESYRASTCVTTQQRPPWPVGGVGDLDATLFSRP